MDILLNNRKIDSKDIPMLQMLSEEELSMMSSSLEAQYVKKGETIFTSGHPADVMFILHEGVFKLSMPLTDGREQIMYIFTSGDFVGGLNILSGDKYVYNAVCLADSLIIKISSEDFRNVLLKNYDFLMVLIEQCYERIRKSESLVDILSGINADMKVAKLLINFANLYGKVTKDGILLDLNINREELGFYSGVTRETISRKLNQFEKAKIVRLLPKGNILIRKMDILENIVSS